MNNNWNTKREMILAAYKWRDNIKKKTDEELFSQLFVILLYLSGLSNLYYAYNNFDKKICLPLELNETENIENNNENDIN